MGSQSLKKSRLSVSDLLNLSPARVIALGFAGVIFLGSLLLMLCVKPGVKLAYVDALYTATSAVCVTGLVVVDPADTFTTLGQVLLGIMMQIGGLGVASIGAGVILAMRRKIDLRGRRLIREGANLYSGKGVVRFVQRVLLVTLSFELIGALLCLPSFLKHLPLPRALGVSLFHAIAAFNNAGFDILGGFQSLTAYVDDVWLNVITCALIFFGGIGFLVIDEMKHHRFHWKSYSMHAKAVLSTSAVLLVGGTVLIRLTEDISWLGACFLSFSTRTAGFSTYNLGQFRSAGLLVTIVLMFIGASSGSTGGGVKTSTLFVLWQGLKASATNQSEKAFRYAIPADAFRKAAVITLMGIAIVCVGTFLLLCLEPLLPLTDALFEITSAFSTAGLSTGITGSLHTGAKILSMLIMYIGRLGPLTIASLWYFSRGERVRYPDGNITVG